MDLLCFCSVLCLLCLCARLFICALWSPAGKGLTSWLSFVVSNCEFVTFPFSVGAKSQILSSVAPPGRKTWPLFSIGGISWGLGKPILLSFLWSIFCKWPVTNVTLLS